MSERTVAVQAKVHTVTAHLGKFIEDGLADGSLTAGSKLPTERSFAEMLEVPRAAVRRALSEHEAAGLVIRHQGRGTFVAPVSTGMTVVDGAESIRWVDTSPAEIMEVRAMVEPQIAYLASVNATHQQIMRMEECLREASKASSYEGFEIWDGALHRTIAEGTHNAFLLRIFDQINGVRKALQWGQLKRRSFTPDRRMAYEQQHEAIIDAIRDRDRNQARRLMVEHLSDVRNNLLNP